MPKSIEDEQTNNSTEERLIDSVKQRLLQQGFELKSMDFIDIVANKGSDYYLIELKAPQKGFITVDTIAQVRSVAKKCVEKLGPRIKPIVIGNFTAAGSTQSVAQANNVHLVNITPETSADVVGQLVDEEIKKVWTDVS